MRRFFVFIALMALSFLVSGIETINFKEVKIQGVWGIQCRKYCSAANGQLCGNVTQSCCQYGKCTMKGQIESCPTQFQISIRGCS